MDALAVVFKVPQDMVLQDMVPQDMVPLVEQGLVKPLPLVPRRRRTRHTAPAY